MKIRKAEGSDLEELVELGLDVHKLHTDKFPDEFRKISIKDLSLFYYNVMERNDYILLVCSGQEMIPGYVLIKFVKLRENPFQKAAEFAYIDQISVKKHYRRKGVGKDLIFKIRDICREKGISQLKLDVWKFNKTAHDFFISQGFSSQMTRMVMETDN